ncbi:hypothetical protein M9Y10_017460 [Tritrichomonas musculus]|uniref:Uncharacterized protein n=1 Tax=Tritrichomonas musculus TaxID=1915356 RepID=A0ABR2HUH5_9EUKA
MLMRIYDYQYEHHSLKNIKEIKAEIDIIQREINYFKVLPALNLNIWFQSKCINQLQIGKIQLNTAFKPEIETRVILQLTKLSKKLEKSIIKNRESYILKNQIVQHIFQIIEQSPNQENYIQCEKCVHHFLDFLENNDNQIPNSLILQPGYTPKIYLYTEDDNIELYKHVIWFSQTKAIVDRIIDPHNKKIYEDIFELNKIPEMQSSAHLLTKELLKTNFNDNYEFSPQIKDSIYSTLNAHF